MRLLWLIKVAMALASGVAAHRFVWPRVRYYWRYNRPYDIAIAAHLVIIIVTKLFGKRAGRYIYTRVF